MFSDRTVLPQVQPFVVGPIFIQAEERIPIIASGEGGNIMDDSVFRNFLERVEATLALTAVDCGIFRILGGRLRMPGMDRDGACF